MALLLLFSQALQSELLKKSQDHQMLNSEGDALIASTSRDQHIIKEELETVNHRWEELSKGIVLLPGSVSNYDSDKCTLYKESNHFLYMS